MQVRALHPSVCPSVPPLVWWPDPDVPPWLGQGLSRQLRGWEQLPRSPSRLPRARTGACSPSPGHPRRAQACWEGLDVAQVSWKVAAAAAPLGRGPASREGPQHPPGTVPTAPPARCSRLRGGLGGVSHSPGTVEGQAEPGGRQQQGQGGQQPSPRVSPTSCCQLHLWGHREHRGSLGYPRPHGDRGLEPCPQCPHNTG